MSAEILRFRVLEDKDAALSQKVAGKYQIDNLRAILQVVGRVGEDDIKLLGATLQIEKGVGLDGVYGV